MALFREYRLSLVPILLEMIRSNETLVDPSDLGAILQKDAVYKAVGLAAFELYDEVCPSIFESRKVNKAFYLKVKIFPLFN